MIPIRDSVKPCLNQKNDVHLNVNSLDVGNAPSSNRDPKYTADGQTMSALVLHVNTPFVREAVSWRMVFVGLLLRGKLLKLNHKRKRSQ